MMMNGRKKETKKANYVKSKKSWNVKNIFQKCLENLFKSQKASGSKLLILMHHLFIEKWLTSDGAL